MDMLGWVLLLGVGGFLAMKFGGRLFEDPAVTAMRDAYRDDPDATPSRRAPVTRDPVSEPIFSRNGTATKPRNQPAEKRLTLSLAKQIRDQLKIKDPGRLAILYTMTRPAQEQSDVLSFIRPKQKPTAIDAEGEPLDEVGDDDA